MPNWTRTKMTITSRNPQKLEEFKEKAASAPDRDGSPRSFSLQAFIPIPEALKNTHSGSTEINGKTYHSWREIDGERIPIERTEESVLLAQYGAANWYDWCCKNWGTKWDVSNLVETEDREPEDDSPEPRLILTELMYEFDTAWNLPRTVIEYIIKQWPGLVFNIEWEDEDTWSGYIDAEDGEIYSDQEWEREEEDLDDDDDEVELDEDQILQDTNAQQQKLEAFMQEENDEED